MKKNYFGVILFTLVCAQIGFAETPKETLAGAVVNQWSQGGLRVTDKIFDLGIQGNGFFPVVNIDTGEIFYTRNGCFRLDIDGYLAHYEKGYRLLVYQGNNLVPLKLSDFAKDSSQDEIGYAKSYRISLDGNITGFYTNGRSYDIAKIALSIFQNPRHLKRISEHLFLPTESSGKAFTAMARSEIRGSIYSASLEELDNNLYEMNLDR